MGVFSRFAARSLAQNKVRTLVSGLGIVLSCALVCAVLTSVVSMNTMLAERTQADEGAWQVEAADIDEEGLELVSSDERVARHLEVAELGCVELGDENAMWYGDCLFVKTWPAAGSGEDGEAPIAAEPELVSGRAPSRPGEIALPHYLEGVELAECGLASDGALQVGGTVSLDLTERTLERISDGERFIAGSAFGSYAPAEEYDVSFEGDLGTVEAEVVGFYRAWGVSSTRALQGNAALLYPEEGCVEAALSDGSDATGAFSLICADDPSQAEGIAADLEAHTASYLDGPGARTHASLLRWQGVRSTSEAWNALYGIAGVLAVVIAVAGVSLVYNSFAISVAERTRQFGLLGSLGASRRQLRRTVLAEALMLAAVCIPLGLALGLAGCWVVFRVTGDGMAALFGAGVQGASVGVVASPAALALSALLTLLTVLVSAWVPALRAGRVSAIDAIRQTKDVRIRARAARRIERDSGGAGRAGIAGRLFGVPGMLARRNLSRTASRGRVTVAALAVSVALLICTGLVGAVMGYASGTVLETYGGVDLAVRIDATAVAGPGGEQLMREDGTYDNAAIIDALDRFQADAEAGLGDGAETQGHLARFVTDVLVPADMVADGHADYFGTDLPDGSWTAPVYVACLDDASWRSYVRDLGLDEERFCDAAHPLAIAVNSYEYADDGTYRTLSPLAGSGEVQALTYATDVPGTEGMYSGGIMPDGNGDVGVWYSAPDGSELFVPLEQGVEFEGAIEVGALADSAPTGLSAQTNTVMLVAPASAVPALPALSFADACLNLSCGGDADAAAAAQDAISEVAAEHPELDCAYENYAQSKAQARLMSDTIQTFIWSFTVVCALIAVANVFNTLTNSLILRRREFAVLRSVGMGGQGFRRMIALECASYAVRGLAIGLALAALVGAGLSYAMGDAFPGFELAVPWAQVALSCAVVLGVLLASTAFALARSKGDNVVESLRSDAI